MPLFGKGFRVGSGPDQDRWLIVKKLGEGQFAEVYEVKDTIDSEKRYALKIERRRDVRSVKQEFKVLKRIQERAPSLVCTVHACGTFEDRFFMIMELLGNNVAEARKAAGGRFDLATARRVASCMLQGLEEVHGAGFVHRDVKPANFAVGPAFADALTGTWKVIDFGLARRYLDDSGEVLPERTDTSFRGSTTYASIHAHAEQDLGRRDDLWSWLYCTIELLEGTLPWRTDTNKDPDSREAVLRLKQACIAEPSRYLRAAHPHPHPHPSTLLQPLLLPPLQQLSNYIASLGFGDAPDYGLMYGWLGQLPDDLPGLMVAGMGPSGALMGPAAMAGVGMGAMAGWGGQEAQYGQQQAAAAAAAAQMMYQQQQQEQQQQYYSQAHSQQPHAPLPPGGYWARGPWPDPSLYPTQPHPPHPQQQQQHPQPPQQQPTSQQPHALQMQQLPPPPHPHARYGSGLPGPPPGGPPPPPDPGRSSPPRDTPTSPPGCMEYGGSGMGGGGGGSGEQQPQPPLPPGQGPMGPSSGGCGVGVGGAGGCVALADVAPEVAEAMLAGALAERSGSEAGREAAQVAEVAEYVELVKQGRVSDEAHDVAGRLMGLEPLEALATISYVLDALAAHALPASANTAAVALSALGAYARDAAKRAMTKYCRALAAQHQPQLPQQPQPRGPGRGSAAGN